MCDISQGTPAKCACCVNPPSRPTAYVAFFAASLQAVCLAPLCPTSYAISMWTRCHQSHTVRDFHAAHVHAALHSDGASDVSSNDSLHVCLLREFTPCLNCALNLSAGLLAAGSKRLAHLPDSTLTNLSFLTWIACAHITSVCAKSRTRCWSADSPADSRRVCPT